MLDQQHGDVALVADAPDQAAEPVDLDVIEPAGDAFTQIKDLPRLPPTPGRAGSRRK